jgi:hypothetical protein
MNIEFVIDTGKERRRQRRSRARQDRETRQRRKAQRYNREPKDAWDAFCEALGEQVPEMEGKVRRCVRCGAIREPDEVFDSGLCSCCWQ